MDAVVSVATSRLVEEDLNWGADCLLNVMDALRRRAQSEDTRPTLWTPKRSWMAWRQ